MKTFEEKYFNYKLMTETPEAFKIEETGEILKADSPDVIAFVYQISTDSLAYSQKGLRTQHFEIVKFIRGKGADKPVKIKGKFDTDSLFKYDIVTGRIWVDHDKISIWLLPEKQLPELEDDGFLKYIVEQIGLLLGIKTDNYEVELAEVLGSSSKRISF